MSQNAPLQPNPEASPIFAACKNCHAMMPAELRFCRNCGYRLGEGTAEYTETVRFQNGRPATLGNIPAAFTSPYQAGQGQMSAVAPCSIGRRRRRMGAMGWIILAVVLFFVTGGGLSQFARRIRVGSVNFTSSSSKSYFGVDGFSTTEGGVTFGDVEPPGSPSDKAGLVGGDVITTFDGQRVTSDDQIKDLLGKTPVGKTVEIIFIRDGETRTTKLTTISKTDFDQLVKAFRSRPAGRGRFGYETFNASRVSVPGKQISGVRLGKVIANEAADLAGIRTGDIVVEFDHVPIRTTAEFESRVHRALPYTTVDVVVMRGGERLVIPVKLGRQ
jgi:membrane-associated protease RseP (regulator of RpoE activity)